jgi:Vam6/Vps39-like protein vacuolar protein sorting-associated protein 39
MSSEADGDQRAVFRTSPLVSDFDGKIECLTHYSSRVVIGSSDGRLVMFDTRKGPTTPPSTFHQFAHGRPVEQLIAVPHIRMVIVVSNGQLSAHGATDLKALDFDFSHANAHEVKVCCINQRGPPHFRLGVAQLKRKSIVIYQYQSSEKAYQYLREFSTTEVPESMSWYRNKVIVGYRKDYFILNDKSGEAQPINSPGIQNAQVIPVVKLLPNEETLITVMDKVGVFVGLAGEPLPKNSINWSQPPAAIEYTSPYIIGYIPRVGVEIISATDSSVVQMLPIHRVSAIFSNGMKFDMEPRPSGDSENVVIVGVRESGSKSSVLKVEQMPMDQQIGELLDRGKIQEAQDIVKKSVAGLSADKQKSKTKRFQRQATVALLRRLEFDSAVDYMFRSAVEPCEFIAFFPEYQCSSFAYEPSILKPEVLPRGASVSPDIKSVIKEIQATQNANLASEIARADPHDLVQAATKALLKFLDKYKMYVREKSQSSRSRAQSRSRSASASGSNAPKDPRRAEAIDTALFRLYVKYNRQKELLTLLEDTNSESDGCNLEMESCQALLLNKKLYYELGQLHLVQGKYREATEVYARMHAGEYKQSKVPKPAIDAAIDVLIAVPVEEADLVYEQSIWIMRGTQVKNALRIFTDRAVKFSSNDVVEHLKKHSDDPAIVAKYLETLVKSERDQFSSSSSGRNSQPNALQDVSDSYSNFLAGDGDGDAIVVPSDISAEEDTHHTRLAMEYIDEVLKLVNAGEAPSKSHPGKEPGALGDARKRLLRFLKSSSSRYDASQLVSKVRRTPLYNELVILCGRGGFHEEAVRALVLELNDLKGAESYATKYGVSRSSAAANKTKTERNNALLELLKICFNPQEESKKAAYNDFAFQLLGRHGKTMDGKMVLELIPASTPLNKLVEYFSQCLPHSAHNVRETRIGLSLSNIYNLQVQCDRVEKLNQYVEIDPQTVCFSCKKRIGDIMFSVYPHGKVVHYNCMNGRPDVCPVTGEQFS